MVGVSRFECRALSLSLSLSSLFVSCAILIPGRSSSLCSRWKPCAPNQRFTSLCVFAQELEAWSRDHTGCFPTLHAHVLSISVNLLHRFTLLFYSRLCHRLGSGCNRLLCYAPILFNITYLVNLSCLMCLCLVASCRVGNTRFSLRYSSLSTHGLCVHTKCGLLPLTS